MALIEIPFDVVDDQVKKLQRGMLALWRDYHGNLPAEMKDVLKQRGYMGRLVALHDATSRYVAQDYARLLKLKATHGWLTLQSEASDVVQAIQAYAKQMDALNKE